MSVIIPTAIWREVSGFDYEHDPRFFQRIVEIPHKPTAYDQPVVNSFLSGNLIVNSHTPEPAYRYAASATKTFGDDWFDRIHIMPGYLNLGNLLSSQTRDIEVWNAYRTSKTLSRIDAVNNDGVLLNEPEAAPTDFGTFESRVYSLSVEVNGPPTISAQFNFVFSHGETVDLEVIGKRVVVWPFSPQHGATEGIEWKTDVLTTYEGEQRFALRQLPRQTFDYSFQLDEREFSHAKAISTEWSHRVYGVPVWTEYTHIGRLSQGTSELVFDHAFKDYRSGDVLIVWESAFKYEAVEIAEILEDRITLNLPLAEAYNWAYVMPLRFGRTLKGVSFQRDNSPYSSAKALFTVTDSVSHAATVYPLYRQHEVVNTPSVVAGAVSEAINRDCHINDTGLGIILVNPKQAFARHKQKVTWSLDNLEQLWMVRQFLHAHRGMQKPFWLPTWSRDLTILTTVGAASTGMTVANIGYSLYYKAKDILVLLKDGTQFYRRVTGGSVDSDGNEALQIDMSLGQDVSPDDVELICFMELVRFDTDSHKLKHNVSGCIVSSPVITVNQNE